MVGILQLHSTPIPFGVGRWHELLMMQLRRARLSRAEGGEEEMPDQRACGF
jgi:hypothetical protein